MEILEVTKIKKKAVYHLINPVISFSWHPYYDL